MDQIVGEYTRACVYIQAGLQQNSYVRADEVYKSVS